MSIVTSFNPIVNPFAHTLVLGSIPGVFSLKAGQYYAHPRNAFWPIMARMLDFNAEASYDERVEALQASGIALWDVLNTCSRTGSLDSAIKPGSRVPNDFAALFDYYPNIKLVGFNGAEAEKSFIKYVRPGLDVQGVSFVRLPSSSPAHAVGLEKKIDVWRKRLGA